MAKKEQKQQEVSKDAKYIKSLFVLLKKRDYISFMDKQTNFNDAEIRLLSEVFSAKYEGKRLISTQLAKNLGVTRSAISQIVKRMEKNGIVKRVPDAVDRKIAYIEIADERLEECDANLKACKEFLARVVKKFGEEKFEKMCDTVNEFMELIETERDLSAK